MHCFPQYIDWRCSALYSLLSLVRHFSISRRARVMKKRREYCFFRSRYRLMWMNSNSDRELDDLNAVGMSMKHRARFPHPSASSFPLSVLFKGNRETLCSTVNSLQLYDAHYTSRDLRSSEYSSWNTVGFFDSTDEEPGHSLFQTTRTSANDVIYSGRSFMHRCLLWTRVLTFSRETRRKNFTKINKCKWCQCASTPSDCCSLLIEMSDELDIHCWPNALERERRDDFFIIYLYFFLLLFVTVENWRVSNWYNYLLSLVLTRRWHLLCQKRDIEQRSS